MTRATRAVIDLGALRHNLQRVRAVAPQSRMMAIIKADAYGHGMLRVAEALCHGEGDADAFGVTCVSEALSLCEAGVEQPIIALQGFRDEAELIAASRYGIDLTLHQDHQLRLLETTRLHEPVGVWIKLDTGMHRLGFAPERTAAIHQALSGLATVKQTPRLMTHLARADEREGDTTAVQIERFGRAVEGLNCEQSIANSAGILAWRASHRHWVRPGLMLYGASPFPGSKTERHGLKPVMTLKAPLIAVQQQRRGDEIGYGGAWACPEDMRIGIAAIGYGDGYPRHAPSGTPVLINGRRAQLVGRVSMDMITIDLRDAPEAAPGDDITLWGQGLPVEEIAEKAGTLSYELLCAVGRRVSVETVD